MKAIAILVSGYGSNMLSIINATNHGILKDLAKVTLVISSNANAYSITVAKRCHIKVICIMRSQFNNKQDFDTQLLNELIKEKIDIICLAGYIKMLGSNIVKNYKNRILNVHPSLLPKFGGKGMYGHYVHEAVVKAKDNVSGATVHLVDESYDTGKIIIQEKVHINRTDAPSDVAQKVLTIEHNIYPKAIKHIINKLERFI
ncbi:MAG: phosphoribosylglycinamide formyltransferase [Endomicrobium sp.]|jgi:phosphoribosylglycinamide formyltransferase-1|nr:phosphoribosylglycinamide formyltransferase [Endomicrobium sp.]